MTDMQNQNCTLVKLTQLEPKQNQPELTNAESKSYDLPQKIAREIIFGKITSIKIRSSAVPENHCVNGDSLSASGISEERLPKNAIISLTSVSDRFTFRCNFPIIRTASSNSATEPSWK